jgi:hypothetical protein
MSEESGEASAPNPPSTLGPVVAGNKNDTVGGSNNSNGSSKSESKSKRSISNGNKECSKNVTTDGALEDATRKNETKQASSKASSNDNNNNNNNNNTKINAQLPPTPSWVTVATNNEKNKNKSESKEKKNDSTKDVEISSNSGIAIADETNKQQSQKAPEKNTIERGGSIVIKIGPQKASASPKDVGNTTDRKTDTEDVAKKSVGIVDDKTKIETKKPSPKAVGTKDVEMSGGIIDDRTESTTTKAPPKAVVSNTTGTKIDTKGPEKSGGIADQKIQTETMKPSPTTVGNSNSISNSNNSKINNNSTNDVKMSGGITNDLTESKTKTKEAPPKAVGNITGKTHNTKAAEKNSNSKNSSSSSNNINKNNVERSGGVADDLTESKAKKAPPKVVNSTTYTKNDTESKMKKAPPKVVNNITGTKNDTKDAEKSSGIAGGNTRSETKTPSTNDVEMSGGIADDQTELKAKKAPPKEAGNTADTADRDERTQKRKQTTTNTTGVDDSKEYSSENSNLIGQMDYGKSFRSSAEDALAKALSLVTPQTPNENLVPTPKASAAVERKEQPNETEIPIEVLRDLINQHPGEFWQSIDNREVNEPTLSKTYKTTTGGNVPIDLVFFERTETVPPRKEGAENENCSENQAKRRKLECGERDRKEIPSIEDSETLAAVRVLLEASIHQLSSTGRGDAAAKRLLEQVNMLSSKAATSVSADTGGKINTLTNQPLVPMEEEKGCVVRGEKEGRVDNGVRDMARKVTLSFVQDLSEILRAIANARSSIGAAAGKESTDENKGNRQLSKPPAKPLEPAVEDSLLCDEEDLVQLKEDGDHNMDDDDDDDEIIEISQDENYVQQHLICQETLFGESTNHKSESVPIVEDVEDASDDILFVQKVALLRETKRLIRAKTLVLTKRRLAIQGDEDLSVVI